MVWYGLFLLACTSYFFINAPETFFLIKEETIFNTNWYLIVNFSFLSLANVFYILFISSIFDHGNRSPDLEKLVRTILIFIAINYLLFLTLPYFRISTQMLFYLGHLVVLPVSIYILWFLKKEQTLTNTYLMTGIIFNVFGSIVTLCMIIRYNLGIRIYALDNYPLFYMRVGILCEIFFFQMAIIKNWIQKEKEILYKDLELQNKVTKIRSDISSDLHDEIGSALSKISMTAYLESTQSATPELKSTFQKISKDTGEILSLMKEIVWSLDPINGSFGFKEKIDNYIREIKELTEIKILYDNKLTDKNLLNDLNFTHHLSMIIKEAINNALKYSKASFIDVKLNDHLLRIKDDGIGFNRDEVQLGNGLKNIKKRCQKIKCSFEITSERNKGVEIKIIFNPP